MAKKDEKQQDVKTTVDWREEISSGLVWLNDRAWPLAGAILFIATLYLHDYIHDEKVPLSITSSSVVTALPMLFGLMVFAIMIVTGLVIVPTAILFTPITKQGKSLMDQFEAISSTESGGVRSRGFFIVRWLLGLLAFSLLLLAISFLPEEWEQWIGVGALIAVPLSALGFIYLILWGQLKGTSFWRSSGDFQYACWFSAVLQLVVMVFLVSVAAKKASGYVETRWGLLPILVGALFVLGTVQLAGARVVYKVRNHARPLTTAVQIATGLVVLVGLFPPAGAKLAGYAMQSTASGGHSCVVLKWVPEPAASTKSLNDPDASEQSQELRILAEADGDYIVRSFGVTTEEVDFVPRSSVAGMDKCPEQTKSK